MEKDLFKWQGWDELDTVSSIFYNIELVVPIGQHKPGELFKSACINYSTGALDLYKDESDQHESYYLKLVVV